jgi:peptidoglycan LD-endopeptidase CwlK
MLNLRTIDSLELNFKMKVMQWRDACEADGLDILIVRTACDAEYQDWLYASGRTREGRIVTMAKGGQSMHEKREAVDFCIMDGKRCDWHNIASFTKAGIIAERIGLVWGGRWNGKLKDFGHIESQH